MGTRRPHFKSKKIGRPSKGADKKVMVGVRVDPWVKLAIETEFEIVSQELGEIITNLMKRRGYTPPTAEKKRKAS
jgi:hypothetical protein